jgi:curved DNA-binding protein CbpA
MSAPLAGKFQDHYALLGLDPKSDSAAIQAAYTKAAEKYHPGNPDTGDKAKFDAVNMAFEVLADPILRREFDKLKGVDQDDGVPKFSGKPFFEALGRETRLRVALLCILYDRRRTKPFTPSLSMRQVENSLHTTEAELSFALWYLKQRGLAGQDDKSSLLITVEGMDYLESNQPAPEAVMPFIKAGALATQAAAPEEAKPETVKPEATEPASNDASKNGASTPLATLASALAESATTIAAATKPEEPTPHKEPESVRNFMRRTHVRA